MAPMIRVSPDCSQHLALSLERYLNQLGGVNRKSHFRQRNRPGKRLGDDKVYDWFANTPRSLGVEKINPGVCAERELASQDAYSRIIYGPPQKDKEANSKGCH